MTRDLFEPLRMVAVELVEDVAGFSSETRPAPVRLAGDRIVLIVVAVEVFKEVVEEEEEDEEEEKAEKGGTEIEEIPEEISIFAMNKKIC